MLVVVVAAAVFTSTQFHPTRQSWMDPTPLHWLPPFCTKHLMQNISHLHNAIAQCTMHYIAIQLVLPLPLYTASHESEFALRSNLQKLWPD